MTTDSPEALPDLSRSRSTDSTRCVETSVKASASSRAVSSLGILVSRTWKPCNWAALPAARPFASFSPSLLLLFLTAAADAEAALEAGTVATLAGGAPWASLSLLLRFDLPSSAGVVVAGSSACGGACGCACGSA